MAKLTDRQKKFVDCFIVSGVAETAALEAGYSVLFARSGSSKLLAYAGVQEYLTEQLEKLSSSRIADAKEVMEYLTSVMRREHKENVVVTLSREKSCWEPDDSGTMRKVTVREEVPEVVEIPSKLSDSNKAAELLGKRYSMFTDRVDVNLPVTVVIDDDYGE